MFFEVDKASRPRPPKQTAVKRYWAPEEFEELEAEGRALGLEVLAGPFVRSSYRAEEAFLKVIG